MKKESVKEIRLIIICVLTLLGFYFLTRLINLTIIPIFTDEAIYLRWGQIALADPKWRFISLIDGKQPLLIWLFLPVLKLMSDPLVAGRLVSVAAGFFGMIGLMSFSWYLTRSVKSIAISGLLYILSPFFLIYDRLALYDGLLSAICIWALFLSYLMAKKLRLDVALILGMVIGLGLLTKSSALFYLMLLPAGILITDWPRKSRARYFLKWTGLCMAVIVQSQIYENIMRLSEFRHNVAAKNLSFIYSFSEIIKDPFRSFIGNLTGLFIWLSGYMTWPLLILILVALFWLIRKNWRLGLFLLSYFLVPFLALALFGRVIYPRFLLFMIPPLFMILILFLTTCLSIKKSQKYFLIIMLLIGINLLIFDQKILFNPVDAPLPNADKQQLLNDWPAGYGIKEVVNYLEQESRKSPVVIGTDGTFGLFPMALELYLGKNVNVTIKAYWPLNEFPKELGELAKTNPTFMVFKERDNAPPEWPVKLIDKYQRGSSSTYLRFYRVQPK